jgi:hypothetical protein
LPASRGATPLRGDAATRTALHAVERRASRIFNIAEPNAYAATEAASILGGTADFRAAPL